MGTRNKKAFSAYQNLFSTALAQLSVVCQTSVDECCKRRVRGGSEDTGKPWDRQIARIPLLFGLFALKIPPASTGNYGSITRTHLSLPVNTVQASRDYWGKN